MWRSIYLIMVFICISPNIIRLIVFYMLALCVSSYKCLFESFAHVGGGLVCASAAVLWELRICSGCIFTQCSIEKHFLPSCGLSLTSLRIVWLELEFSFRFSCLSWLSRLPVASLFPALMKESTLVFPTPPLWLSSALTSLSHPPLHS